MLQWFLYVVTVSALLSVAGWLAEQALRQCRLQTRWVWVGAIALTALFTCLSWPPAVAPQAFHHRTLLQSSWTSIQRVAPVALPQLASSPATPAAYAATMQHNAVIVRVWLLLSTGMILAVAANAIHVFRQRRVWPLRLLGSHCVGITPDIGPAVVGLLRPTIAIPRWVLDREGAQQELILAHEAAHLQARDPLLVTFALLALILMPWNVLLWWHWHRLRHAMEVDCDARVLRAGHDTRAYGEALIDVGQQRSRFVGVAAAMSETRTLLERRVEIMAARNRKPSICAVAALGALSAVIAAAATQITAPGTPGNRQEIRVDAATLDRYVGQYQISSQGILAVTREGSQLQAQITGQPRLPIYPRTPNTFFWKAVDAEITFSTADAGPAGSATIHQNGRDLVAPRLGAAAAQAILLGLAERVDRQEPRSGSEAALRKSIAAIAAGTPNYDDMSAALQDATRQQLPIMQGYLEEYGPVQSVEFKGVTPSGADRYLVTYRSGRQSRWFISLDGDGKITGMLMREPF